MSIFIKNNCYTCKCYLDNIKYPNYIKDNQLVMSKNIYKCKKCNTKIYQQDVSFSFNHPNEFNGNKIQGFCGGCNCFVLNNEIFEDSEYVAYNIILEPLYGRGCDICYKISPLFK